MKGIGVFCICAAAGFSAGVVLAEQPAFDATGAVPFQGLESLTDLAEATTPDKMFEIISHSGALNLLSVVSPLLEVARADPTAQVLEGMREDESERAYFGASLLALVRFFESKAGKTVLHALQVEPEETVRQLLGNPQIAAYIRDGGIILGYLVQSWRSVLEADPSRFEDLGIDAAGLAAAGPGGAGVQFSEFMKNVLENPNLSDLQQDVADEFKFRTGLDIVPEEVDL